MKDASGNYIFAPLYDDKQREIGMAGLIFFLTASRVIWYKLRLVKHVPLLAHEVTLFPQKVEYLQFLRVSHITRNVQDYRSRMLWR